MLKLQHVRISHLSIIYSKQINRLTALLPTSASSSDRELRDLESVSVGTSVNNSTQCMDIICQKPLFIRALLIILADF